jgi:hypothetical protein
MTKKTYAAIVFFSLLCISALSAQSFTIKKQQFKTPEAAIEYFIGAVTENDLMKAFEACAVAPYAEGFDFKAFAKRLNAIVWTTSLSPSEYELYRQMNMITVMSRISNQIKFFSYSLLYPGTDFMQTKLYPGNKAVDHFVRVADPKKLSTLKLRKVLIPEIMLTENPRIEENAVAQALPLGADTSTERLAVLTWEGKAYGLGIHLLRYGEDWYIDSLVSNYEGTSVLGTAVEVSPEMLKTILD